MFARALLRRSGRQLRQLHSMPEHPHKGTVAALLHQRPFQRVEHRLSECHLLLMREHTLTSRAR